MIKEAILSITITLFYGTDDTISIYSVDVPVKAGIEKCEEIKENMHASHFILQADEMDGMKYRFKGFCNEI